jgi:hypothetical protein
VSPSTDSRTDEALGWEGLEGTYGLPDPDDEHLVAVAVVGGAAAMVTDNAHDLPLELMPNGIEYCLRPNSRSTQWRSIPPAAYER